MPDKACMKRRTFLRNMAGATLATGAFTAIPGCRTRPVRPTNVVLIMTDDQGWGDVHAHGNPAIDTPVLDRLASESVCFDLFYVSPVCAPTRASLLSGRYHLRTGVSWVTRGLETMRAGEVTIAGLFRKAGYATGCFGKWHNGAHFPHHPLGRGFDEFFGFCAGHWNNYFNTHLEKAGQMVETNGYITDVLTDAALDFIERNAQRPFFCYVPYNAPHSPFQVPDKYFDKYKAKGLNDKDACIYGMVENIDDNVGSILQKLQELGLSEDTIVLFLTDNGPNGERFNGQMRGIKGSVHEGGGRVPLFIRWPQHLPAGRLVRPIAAHIDLLPTLLDLCHIPVPDDLQLDGLSLAPLMTGDDRDWPDRLLFTHQSRHGEVALGPGAVRSQKYRMTTDGQRWELYDLITDPCQKVDISAQEPGVAAYLRKAYETWYANVTNPTPERLPIPVGYEQAPAVQLPAPEAYLQGEVSYKGGHGWANDWITNWKSPEDRIAWDLEVVRGGDFQVTLWYTCPSHDLGAVLRVQTDSAHIDASVLQAHDPVPLPSPDRVPRGEVYEKVWAPLAMGLLHLEKGRQRLVLAARSIPGQQVMDLKSLTLERKG